jgi:hypothetical protein
MRGGFGELDRSDHGTACFLFFLASNGNFLISQEDIMAGDGSVSLADLFGNQLPHVG